MRAFLHSRRDLDIRSLRRQYEQGQRLDPTPYGIRTIEGSGAILDYSEGSPPSKLDIWLFNRFGFDPRHALRNLRSMRRADVIWTVLEWEWMGASFLQRLRLLQRKPIIGNNVFLAQEYAAMPRLRRLAYKMLMTDTVYLTVHAKRAASELETLFPGRRFHLSHFGIPTTKFPVTVPRNTRLPGPLRIYSIGGDKGRDWTTLLQAFGNDPRFELRIVARRLSRAQLAPYANVQFADALTEMEERENYRWADYVVVAMHENIYSGITVMCEAAASGVPMIVSRTGGAETYFDASEVFYVEPSRPEDLARVAASQSPESRCEKAAAAQRRFLSAGYSSDDMVRRYGDLSRNLCARTSPGKVI